jgi:hypothetical protein
MNPFDPTNLISLRGLGTMRGFTASLPTDTVRKLLPHGLELGAQSVTAPGTHPVLFGFNDMFRLHWSFPSLLPNETYRELSVGVPFAYLTQGQVTSQSPGPYYFMPQLYLDNLFAVVGGTLLWGFNKQLANFLVTAERYDVRPRVAAIRSRHWNGPMSASIGRSMNFRDSSPSARCCRNR